MIKKKQVKVARASPPRPTLAKQPGPTLIPEFVHSESPAVVTQENLLKKIAQNCQNCQSKKGQVRIDKVQKDTAA